MATRVIVLTWSATRWVEGLGGFYLGKTPAVTDLTYSLPLRSSSNADVRLPLASRAKLS
jgi:hypothetical protein